MNDAAHELDLAVIGGGAAGFFTALQYAEMAEGRRVAIFEKGGVRVKSTDSHASLFTSNTEVVLAEKRTGLAVHRPDGFVNTTLDITA